MINLIATCVLVYECAEIPCLSIISKNPVRDNVYYSDLLGCNCFHTIEYLIDKVKKFKRNKRTFINELDKHMTTHMERLRCDLFVMEIINFFVETVNSEPEEIKEGENEQCDHEMHVDGQIQIPQSEWFDKILQLNPLKTRPEESAVERKKRICREFAVRKVNEFTKKLVGRTFDKQFEISEMCFKFFNLDTFECMHGSECLNYKKEEPILILNDITMEESSME